MLFLSLVAGLFSGFASDAGGDVVRQRYTFAMDTPGGSITGILILAGDGSDVTKGSIINEFGFSAIDFTYNTKKHKVKLLNVIKFLDKWRVRYVLRRDLSAIMQVINGEDAGPSRGYELTSTGDTVVLRNTRRNITYTFAPLL